MHKTFISRFGENEGLEMCDNLKSLQMSWLYAPMTPKLFKTNKMNNQTCWFKIQQHIEQIIHFLMHLITKFENAIFCVNVTQNVKVLRGAYPTWI